MYGPAARCGSTKGSGDQDERYRHPQVDEHEDKGEADERAEHRPPVLEAEVEPVPQFELVVVGEFARLADGPAGPVVVILILIPIPPAHRQVVGTAGAARLVTLDLAALVDVAARRAIIWTRGVITRRRGRRLFRFLLRDGELQAALGTLHPRTGLSAGERRSFTPHSGQLNVSAIDVHSRKVASPADVISYSPLARPD